MGLYQSSYVVPIITDVFDFEPMIIPRTYHSLYIYIYKENHTKNEIAIDIYSSTRTIEIQHVTFGSIVLFTTGEIL